MDELLSIGEFSSRCGLSIKMLRSYADAGLLPPAAVDATSGYRYYSINQLDTARVIGLLRRAGIAIDEIYEFLSSADAARIDRWEKEIRLTSTSRNQALQDARAALALSGSPFQLRSTTTHEGNAMTTQRLAAVTATAAGNRASNEDAVLISDRLYVVADGISGLDNGMIASRTAVDTLASSFEEDPTVVGLLTACRQANLAVRQQTTTTHAESLMGTTLTALALMG